MLYSFENHLTKVMNHALFSKYSRARYVIGFDGWVAYFARFVPAFIMDRICKIVVIASTEIRMIESPPYSQLVEVIPILMGHHL